MAEEVDPAEAAPAGYASEYSDAHSTVTGVTYDADTPIAPRCVVTEEMDLSPKRRVAYRAGSAGWVKTMVDQRLSATKSNLSIRGKATIRNMVFRKPDGVDLNPGRGP
eukprot:2847899-Pyramimonas_sp.AAC.1